MSPLSPHLPSRFPRLAFLFSPIIRPQCLVCHRPLRAVFPVTPTICVRCIPRQTLAVDPEAHCSRCGLSAIEPACEKCTIFPLPFSSVRASFHYRGNIRDLVRAMKFTPSKKLAQVIAHHLRDTIIAESSRPEWDGVVAIPSGRQSSRKRLFTPAAVAAHTIAEALSIPYLRDGLVSTHTRPPQASILLTTHRFQNSRQAFMAKAQRISGKKILLIDDVITTGATIGAGVRELLDAGAASVDVRAFAIADRYERTRRELYAFFQRREHNR